MVIFYFYACVRIVKNLHSVCVRFSSIPPSISALSLHLLSIIVRDICPVFISVRGDMRNGTGLGNFFTDW